MSQKLDKLVQDLESVKAAADQSRNSLDSLTTTLEELESKVQSKLSLESLTKALEELDAKIKSSLVGKSGEVVKYPHVTKAQVETTRERILTGETKLSSGARISSERGTYRLSRAGGVTSDIDAQIQKINELKESLSRVVVSPMETVEERTNSIIKERIALLQEERQIKSETAKAQLFSMDEESLKNLTQTLEEIKSIDKELGSLSSVSEIEKIKKVVDEYTEGLDKDIEKMNQFLMVDEKRSEYLRPLEEEFSKTSTERETTEFSINTKLEKRAQLLQEESHLLTNIEGIIDRIASSEIDQIMSGHERRQAGLSGLSYEDEMLITRAPFSVEEIMEQMSPEQKLRETGASLTESTFKKSYKSFEKESPEAIQTLTKNLEQQKRAYIDLGTTIDSIYTKTNLLDDGTKKYTSTLKSGGRIINEVVQYVTAEGKAFDSASYKIEQHRQKLLEMLQGVEKFAGRGGVQALTTRGLEEGFTGPQAIQSVKSVPGTDLIEVNLKETINGIEQKIKLYINSLGEVFTEAERLLRKEQEAINNRITHFRKVTGESAQEILTRAGKYGYKETDIKDVSTGFTSGITTVQFENSLVNAGKKLEFFMDKSGKVYNENEKAIMLETERRRRLVGQLELSVGKGKADALFKEMEKYGFSPQGMKRVHTQMPGGQLTAYFEQEDAAGIMQKAEITMDKHGKTIVRTHSRLMSFTDAIKRNTVELLKWSVGIGLVYGTFFKLREIIDTAIDNEAKLMDITISLGNAQRDLNDIFDDAAEVADATGESINGVLESYALAYRAVGAVEDPIKRTAAANQLLTDATILNKLSALESADSIDVLAGSLRQLQKPGESMAEVFTRGTDLLDKWVAVSRKANVDLATLATAFSITAESAENSGLSIEELNAMIAALAEKIGGLGGRETGNAVRAIIGGVYQQQAVGILARYGISVQDASGNMRDFLDISRDIYELYSEKIIDDAELNKIGYVLGGGVRRGQQYVAFLSDFEQIQRLTNEQITASGSAQEALDKKLSTVQTSITRLGNSTQAFAQTLGSEGGLLGISKALIETFSLLIDLLDKFTEITGGATVPLAIGGLLAANFGAFGKGGPIRASRYESAVSGVSGSIDRFLYTLPGAAGGYFRQPVPGQMPGQGTYTSSGFVEQPQQTRSNVMGAWMGEKISKQGLGLALAAIPAIQQLGEGDYKEAGYVFGTGAIGALLGGAPWAIVGSMIGDAFVRQMEKSKGNIEDALSIPLKVKEEEETEEEKDRTRSEKAVAAFFDNFEEEQAAIFNILTRFRYDKFPSTAVGTPYENVDLSEPLTTPRVAKLQAEYYVKYYEEMFAGTGRKPGKAIEKKYKEALEVLNSIIELEDITPDEVTVETSKFGQAVGEVSNQFGSVIEEAANAFRDDLRKQSIEGDIKPRDYRTGAEKTFGLESNVSRITAALNAEQEDFNKNINTTQEEILELSDIILKASTEDATAITEVVGEIEDLRNVYQSLADDSLEATVDWNGELVNSARAMELVILKQEELLALLNLIKDVQLMAGLETFNMPPIIEAEGLTKNDAQKVEERAREMQKRLYSKLVEEDLITQEQFQKLIQDAEPIFIDLGEKLGYYLTQGIINSSDISTALAQLIEEGIIEGTTEGFGYQFLDDVTLSQFQSIMPEYEKIKAQIEAAGGEINETPLVTFFKDPTNPMLMTKDWAIVQYLLQEILKTEEKQLDGIYNLPSGASFYVPFQALKLQPQGGEEGGVGDLGPAVDKFDAAVENFAENIRKFHEGEEWSWGLYEDWKTHENQKAFRSGDEESWLAWLEYIKKMILESQMSGWGGKVKEFQDKEAESWAEWEDMQNPFGGSFWEKMGNPFKPDESGETPFGQAMANIIEALSEGLNPPIREDAPSIPEWLLEKLSPFGIAVDNFGNTIELFKNWFNEQAQGIFGTAGVREETALPGGGVEKESNIQTSLTLDLNSVTQLVVDGRVLAEVVKPYLYEDMVDYEGAGNGANRNYTL